MISFVVMLFVLTLCGLHALRIGGSAWKASTSQTAQKKEAISFTQRVGSSFRSSSQWLKGICLSGSAHQYQKSPLGMSMMMDTQQSLLDTIPAATNPSYQHKLLQHENMVEGKLDNGLSYVILPNAVPAGRFEAHLEILSGSAKELEHQQGMAHLLEHVAYMGSPKRQLISGTGSRTNAYTDFHHTVFFASCPTQTPDQFWKRPMLPMALDALLDVMTLRVEDDRLDKERAAVLSEASMVNKMEYRVECQILSALHTENRISTRFPIGKEHLIKIWTKEDLQLYHDTHYRPDNSVLFVVGDLDVASTVASIQSKFGHLRAKTDARTYLRNSGEFPTINMRDVSPHFPPVTHKWSCREEESSKLLPLGLVKPKHKGGIDALATPADRAAAISASLSDAAESVAQRTSQLAATAPVSAVLPNLRVFQHELLQAFSFHLFAKRPIVPITSHEALRRELMQRMVLSALQIRLNVQQRQDPLFTFADFNQLNWPREGCAVCSLDLTTDISTWREAISVAVQEIRRLGLYGLTASELRRYVASLQGEVAQIAAQSEQQPHEEIISELMEARANGHTFLHPLQRHLASTTVLAHVSLEEVNEVARQLCEHLSHIDVQRGVLPAAVIACAPLLDRAGSPFPISEQDVAEVVEEALRVPLHPLEDKAVPTALLSADEVARKVVDTQPRFLNDGEEMEVDQEEEEEEQGGVGSQGSGMNGSVVSGTNSGSGGLVGSALSSLFGGSPAPTTSSTITPTTTPAPSTLVSKPLAPNGLGVVQARLSNGMRVNMKSLDSESQRVSMRLYVPGGRLLERSSSPGEVALGARTMQEGGAFSTMSREDVELFCIDNQVMVEVTATDEALIFDFESLTTKPSHSHSTSSSTSMSSEEHQQAISGVEAIMQVAHIILTDFTFEPDAFERAKQGMREQFDTTVKGLESACTESMVYSLTGADPRFLVPNHQQIEALTLPGVREAMLHQLQPAQAEVSLCGDLPLEHMQHLVLRYLGTVPRKAKQNRKSGSESISGGGESTGVDMDQHSAGTTAATTTTFTTTVSTTPLPTLQSTPVSLPVRCHGAASQLGVFLPDSEERAMGYLTGPAPNSWGRGGGKTLYERYVMATAGSSAGKGVSDGASASGEGSSAGGSDGSGGVSYNAVVVGGREEKWKDPLFARAALLILQEVANRRLFTVVREERQLTYDASFAIQPRDVLEGSWYTVSVTSSPSQVQAALTACREALHSLRGAHGVSGDSVQSAKRTLSHRAAAERLTNKFWVEGMSGTQSPGAKDKTLRSIEHFDSVLQEVTVADVQFLVDVFAFVDNNMTACVGVTAPEPPQGML